MESMMRISQRKKEIQMDDKNIFERFYTKIGIHDRAVQQGMSMFWLIASSLIVIAFATSLLIKFIQWLF